MLKAGVKLLGLMKPKYFLGSTPSRPITYIRRDTPAWAEMPEAITVTMAKLSTTDWKKAPPTSSRISGWVSSTSSKYCSGLPGKYSCMK